MPVLEAGILSEKLILGGVPDTRTAPPFARQRLPAQETFDVMASNPELLLCKGPVQHDGS